MLSTASPDLRIKAGASVAAGLQFPANTSYMSQGVLIFYVTHSKKCVLATAAD